MLTNWIKTTIGDQATLQRGYDITKAEQRAGTVPVISSGGISSFHDTAPVKGPGVVLGRKGVVGSVFFVSSDYWPHDTTLWVKDFHGNDPRFVYYFFKHFAPTLGAMDVGSANPTLNRNHVHPIQIMWPPLSKQRAISHILGTLDDKIEINRKMTQTLEAMARAVFKSWFVDFDPVRAKAEGRDTDLPPDLAALFPDDFEDSEVGKIPKGWGVIPLPKAIEVNPSRLLRKGDVAPYLDMANMPTHGHSPNEVVDRPFGSGMRFVNGDTLFARITPCLENGKTAFVDFLTEGQVGWGSTEYIVLRPKPPLSEEFAYCLARSEKFRDFAIQSMTGSSGRQRVPAESMSHYLLIAPPEPLAKRFGLFVRPLFVRASATARESRTLAALRDALLPKLLSGEIRVHEAN